jgi:hypothetical protein
LSRATSPFLCWVIPSFLPVFLFPSLIPSFLPPFLPSFFLSFESFSKDLFYYNRIKYRQGEGERKRERNISFSPCRKWEQRLLVLGFFEIGSYELFAWAGFKRRYSWSLAWATSTWPSLLSYVIIPAILRGGVLILQMRKLRL